jgi:hypothetical protein
MYLFAYSLECILNHFGALLLYILFNSCLHIILCSNYFTTGNSERLFLANRDWHIDDITLTRTTVTKTLSLNIFLEGLYPGGGTMNWASDEFGPHFGLGITDQVTVELHNEMNYSSIEYTSGLLNLGTNGNISVNVPGSLSGSY